jgi:hypothetical protein
MAKTLEAATTTDLALDYDVPLDLELDSELFMEVELASDFDIDVIIDPIVEPDFAFSTFALGAEDGGWACEVYVKVVPYPLPDAETPVVSDLA